MAAALKTRPTRTSVAAFLKTVKDEGQRADARVLVQLMEEATGAKGRMWGPSIVGFGAYRYVYASGRSGEWMLSAFSPRKGKMVVYVMSGFEPHADLLPRLGKHSTSVCCLSFKRLADLHLPTLKRMVKRSVALTRKKHSNQA